MSKEAFDKIASGLDEALIVAPYVAEIERLSKQLPETMQNCTIQFKECEYGHGRLTATNWIDHECPTCEIDRLREALTPSGATKAAYAGEFTFRVCIGYEDDMEIYDTITVPWTTIKEIMAAIRARAALEAKDE